MRDCSQIHESKTRTQSLTTTLTYYLSHMYTDTIAPYTHLHTDKHKYATILKNIDAHTRTQPFLLCFFACSYAHENTDTHGFKIFPFGKFYI